MASSDPSIWFNTGSTGGDTNTSPGGEAPTTYDPTAGQAQTEPTQAPTFTEAQPAPVEQSPDAGAPLPQEQNPDIAQAITSPQIVAVPGQEQYGGIDIQPVVEPSPYMNVGMGEGGGSGVSVADAEANAVNYAPDAEMFSTPYTEQVNIGMNDGGAATAYMAEEPVFTEGGPGSVDPNNPAAEYTTDPVTGEAVTNGAAQQLPGMFDQAQYDQWQQQQMQYQAYQQQIMQQLQQLQQQQQPLQMLPQQPINIYNNQQDPMAQYSAYGVGDAFNDFGGLVGDAFAASAGAAGQSMADTIGTLGDAFMPMVGSISDAYQQMESEWGTSPTATPYMSELLQNNPYQAGSLYNDVGQNMTAMMDPGAWEQMAANRLDSAREESLGAMNEGARRMRGGAARGGYNPTAGLSNVYNQHGQNMVNAQRDIFNDTLGNQMQAAGMAGNYALGQEGMERGMYNNALQMMGNAGMYDAQQAGQDYTNFGEFVGGVGQLLGAGAGAFGDMYSSAMGGAGQMAGAALPLIGAAAGLGVMSRRDFKQDIKYLTPKDEDEALRTLRELPLARYNYKDGIGAPKGPQMGAIIDDGALPPEAVAADGDHVNLYALLTMTQAAMKAQERRIAELEARLA
jgi:hypothetical protein